jgi:hypothetical protein
VKKLILAIITIACAARGFAQGTVAFNNAVPGTISTRVFGPSSVAATLSYVGNRPNDTPPGSMTFPNCLLIGTVGGMTAGTTMAQLFGAPGYNIPESSLQAASGITTFRTVGGGGTVAPIIATFNNIPDAAPAATIEMVAWDNSSGLYPTYAQAYVGWEASLVAVGWSGTWNQDHLGGASQAAPNMINSADPAQYARSFNLYYYVPEPTAATLAALGAALLMFRRRK